MSSQAQDSEKIRSIYVKLQVRSHGSFVTNAVKEGAV
jgi:hypothetical protein